MQGPQSLTCLPPCARRLAWGGWAFTVPVEKNYPGITPCFPLVTNVSPCEVAPDQWKDTSVVGFYKVEVGEGGGFWKNWYVVHLLS